MGMIICDKHGETGFMPFVSNELATMALDNVSLEKGDIAYVDVSLIDDEDGEEMYSMRYWMSKKCFDSLNADRAYVIKTDDDEAVLDKIFNPVMKGGGICGKCFEEYIEMIKQRST